MKFSDLMSLEYNPDTEIISLEALIEHFPTTPKDVLEQVYSDHGRKYDFQKQYGEIELDSITWKKIQVSGSEIVNCTYYSLFTAVEIACSRLVHWDEQNWNCIDVRSQIVSHWKKENTWKRPPIFIDGSFIQGSNKYHLVEGHTRLGVLIGLLNRKITLHKDKHLIWYGDIYQTPSRACSNSTSTII